MNIIKEGVHESIESNWIQAKVERTIDGRTDSCRFMGEGARVNVAVADRILLHLLNHISQVDLHTVTSEITRRGISIACAVHPPNVSRSMRDLVATGIVAQSMRLVRGENRRQKVWYLTSLGREMAAAVKEKLSGTLVLVRSRTGDLLEIPASEASDRLRADLDLLSVLMHAQHEGALSYGDIRFGPIRNKTTEPGSIRMMAGAHSTYHTEPPKTREIHGRNEERKSLDVWFSGTEGICTVTGVAGCGKTTLVSDWFRTRDSGIVDMLVMYYPCQPWDTAVGLTTSIFHRLGLGHKNEIDDPYDLISVLPPPGNPLDHDLLRRRLTATLIDEDGVTIRKLNGNLFQHLPIIIGNDAPEKVKQVLPILKKEPELFRRVKALTFVGSRRWNVRVDDKIDIKLPEKQIDKAWSHLATIEKGHKVLNDDVIAVDMRIIDQFIIKLTPAKASVVRKPGRTT